MRENHDGTMRGRECVFWRPIDKRKAFWMNVAEILLKKSSEAGGFGSMDISGDVDGSGVSE